MDRILSDGETLVGSKLSDDYWNAVVNKRSLQLRHLVFDIVLSIIAVGIAIGIRTGIAFTPIVPHFSPTLIFSHRCELIGIIEVNFHHQTTGMFVVQLRIIVVLYCLVDIGFWTLNHQYAIFVITACGTHSIDKGLLIFSQTACQLIVSNILAVVLIGSANTWLVETSKDNMVVIVFESLCNLCPDLGKLLFLECYVSIRCESVVLQPTAIPVLVEYYVEISINTIANNFLNACHPLWIDGAVVGIGNMSHHPCTGDADTLETLRLNEIDELLGGFSFLPCCLCRNSNALP